MTATAPQRFAHAPTNAHATGETCDAPALPTRPAAPLLAVCGVCGGAGASTISALIASAAAAHGHVLVADTGGPSGGLSARTGVQTPWSLPEAAELLVRDPDLARSLWFSERTEPYERRIVAAAPAQLSPTDPTRLERLLEILRHDLHHALVVIDCGTLQHPHGLQTLRAATHVAWVLPDTDRGLAHARALHTLIAPRPAARELILARRDPAAPSTSLRTLARLANARHAPLVHLPILPDDPRRARIVAQVALQAILGALRR
jgi:hypothetical protein